MKKLFTILFVFAGLSSQAQDPFSGLSGRSRTRPNTVIIGDKDIKMRITLDGKENNFSLLKSDMFEYIYDSLSPLGRVQAVSFTDTAAMLRVGTVYVRGKYDANKSYTMYTPAAVTTLVLSAIPVAGPVLGAGFAIPASLTTPKIQYLGHPDVPLVEDRNYFRGYADQARRIKSQRIWLNFGLGFGICLGVMFLNETMDTPFLGFHLLPK